MLIRNQNKTTIVDTTSLAIQISPTDYSIFAYHTNDLYSDNFIPLGIYSSEERSIQVLDALCLEARTCRLFFQMPEDGEVTYEK